jgi:hypothetical protein
VPASRLVETTVPYAMASRMIMGGTGRLIMGAVVIAGTVAAANVLLIACARMLGEMSEAGLVPGLFSRPRGYTIGVLAIAGLGAGLMTFGIGNLIWLKAALLFWILHYALVHLSVFLALRHRTMGGFYYNAGFGAVALLCLFGGVIVADPQCVELLKAMLVLMAAMTGLSFAYRMIRNRNINTRGGKMK